MIQVLTVATLIYAGVLVLALAGSLFAIWRLLAATKSALDDVAEALKEVDRDTAALDRALKPWPPAAAKVASAAAGAEEGMRRAREALAPELDATGTGA